jgi:hypothetical protein
MHAVVPRRDRSGGRYRLLAGRHQALDSPRRSRSSQDDVNMKKTIPTMESNAKIISDLL